MQSFPLPPFLSIDGRLYCKQCYNRLYGPQTRSSDIDHKLINTALIKSEDEKNNCPRLRGRKK